MAVCAAEDLLVSTLPTLTWARRTSAFQVRVHKRVCHSRLRRGSRCVYLEVSTNDTLTYERKVHSHFNIAKVLHRDISGGNIIVTYEGKDLLIDRELAKMMKEGGNRRPDRTVSQQRSTVFSCTHHPGLR